MEKKGTIICLVFVVAIVLSAVAFIIFSGITANEYNYVLLEINPKVEFLCDKKYKVVSVKPLNEDAEILLVGVEYKGMDITKATCDFIDICARSGYIDVDGKDNAVNVTIIDGITQALDVHVMQGINKYLRQNEILCSVTETYEDRQIFNEKKENKVCCSNKYKLIKTMLNYVPNSDIKTLKKLNEVNLIDMVNNNHSEYSYSPTQEQIELKTKLIDFGREKYNKHKEKITNSTQRKFAEKFDEFQKSEGKKYSLNFEKQYTDWQNKHIS